MRTSANRYQPETAVAHTTELRPSTSEGLHARSHARSAAKIEVGSFGVAQSDGVVADAEERLADRIRAHLHKGQLEVKLTDNRYTMLSVRRKKAGSGMYQVRLHHMFADASPQITQALAHYIGKNDSGASRILGDYIDAHQHRVRPKATKTVKLDTKGVCHNLQEIFDSLNRQYFGNQIEASITWGQRCGKVKRRNSIKMGSYALEDKSIRIHRSLDKAYVPRFFVESVVYHEMLHQVHQAPLINGRHQFHSKEFLADEAKFEHAALASMWERDHLEQLLTY